MDKDIKDLIIEIVEDKSLYKSSSNKNEYYRAKYPTLSEQYKVLIQKACEPDFDIDKFLWMLDMKSQVDAKKITTHEASVEVGKVLVDQYVAPKLNRQKQP